jgi:TonB family protein
VRAGDFDRAVATLEALILVDPSSPQHAHTLAVFYWDKASRDAAISREQKTTYLLAGIAASDRALALDPEYPEALTYKNILLRTLATYTTDANEQRRLMQEADTLRARAMELMKQRGATAGRSTGPRDAMPPPPPPPPPPFGMVDGMMPIRVGGNIAPPAKIKDVRPEYPYEAQANRVSGSVIIEAVIDTTGRVRDARVLRSIQLLDDAALRAVAQWLFTPTLLNNAPVPVIMTVTVNFTLQ